MPSKHVVDAVNARLAASWTATPIVDYDEQTETPDAEAFVTVQFPITTGASPVLGRLFWEEGFIRLVLSVRRDVGKDQGLIWSDTLAHIFRVVKFDGIETRQPDGPNIDDSTDNGNWLIFSLIIPYRFEFESAVFEFESV
jgi:hypothetical protein